MNKQVNSHFSLMTIAMLPKFNTEACSAHTNQREGQNFKDYCSKLTFIFFPFAPCEKENSIFSHLLRYSSIQHEFEQQAWVNCVKLYIATEAFNRKSLTLVLLSLINNSLPEKIQNRSKMPQDAPLFKKEREKEKERIHCTLDIRNNYKSVRFPCDF